MRTNSRARVVRAGGLVVVLAASACSRPSSTHAAAGGLRAASAGAAMEVAVAPDTSAAAPTTAVPTTATPTAPTAPVRGTAATPARAPSPPPTAARPAAPAPRAAATRPDGYGGLGTTTSVTSGATTVALSVYPAENYFGEPVQVRATVTSSLAITAVRFDLGDGTTYGGPPLPSWNCPDGVRDAGDGAPSHTYAAAGRYDIRMTVTVVPCQNEPSPRGGWLNPDGTPAVGMPSPWRPTGPSQVVTVAASYVQGADPPPRPVGPPPGA
ncbi:MAG: PKD domain-containing protein [Acidimicrobiales bacterium]